MGPDTKTTPLTAFFLSAPAILELGSNFGSVPTRA